ncbi:BREX system serine/threonine kinase PglW [Knoellia sp. CPCC 206450]|uniref:BREX system serine/threonine kinase PglW n=1 Tax=Knoellia tibetensis TaxID=3404798 RepID=UPI003B42FE04
MRPDSPRWTEVTPSRYAHERDGLEHVRDHLPDSSPYRAWSNFEFISVDGTPYEVDLLVLGPAGLHLVELKAWAGRISGDDYDWWEGGSPGSMPRARRNPLYLTNAKAKAFRSWLDHHAKRLRQNVTVPYVHEALFLHGPGVDGRGLPQHVRRRIYGREEPRGQGFARIVLDGLSREPDRGNPVSAGQEKALARLIADAGLRRAVPQLKVGEWKLEPEPVASGWGWLDNLAEHEAFPDEHARVRRWFQPSGAAPSDIELVRRAAEREYRMLRGLDHPGLIRPKTFAETEGAIAALVYDHHPDSIRLDTWVAGPGASADLGTRLNVIGGIAEVLRYAHGHGLVHRGLDPAAVLVESPHAAEPTVLVRDWQAAGPVDIASGATTHHARDLALHDEAGLSLIYTAPEVLRGVSADRRLADVFSLGALSYLVLTGAAPAADPTDMRARLEREGGLSLSAVLDSPSPELEILVLDATDPRAASRTASIEKLIDGLDGVLEAVTRPEEARTGLDPLEASGGDVLQHGLTVVRELGQGSTSIALLVTEQSGSTAVLKAARDDTKAHRLVEEATVLARVPKSDLVAGLIQGPLVVSGRTCLLVELAGQKTLASTISEAGRLNLDQLQRWGRDLIEMVDLLEQQGITHRDIKPANLAVRKRSSDSAPHLVLFDFSLASVPARDLDAGTPGYRDPFLGTGARSLYDPAAELYAVSVTLHEMATGGLPRWGDARNDPALVDHEVTLDRAAFDPTAAEAMVTFFQRALARDTSARFANPHDLAQAWAAVFTAAGKTDAEEADTAAAQATLESPLSQSGLSARAQSALEQYGLATVGDLLGLDAFELPKLRGAAQDVKNEIVARAREWRSRLGSAAPADPHGRSVDALVSGVLPDGDEDGARVVRFFLGQPDPATRSDPTSWPTPTEVENALDVTRPVVKQAWHEHLQATATRQLAAELRAEVMELLDGLGGAATADEIAKRLLDARGSHAQEPQRTAQALALLHMVVDSPGSAGTVGMRRVSDVVMVAGDSDGQASVVDERLDTTARLARAAEDLGRGETLATPATVAERLGAIVAGTALEGLSASRVLSLAAAASGAAAVSGRGELYERGMSASRALRLAAGSLVAGAHGLKPHTIQSRVRARFPEAQPLPDRPQLDVLLAESGADLVWNGDVFQPRSSASSGTGARSSTWHGPTGTADVRQVDDVLRRSLAEQGFLALAVSQRHAAAATRRLRDEFAVPELDVTAWLMANLRREADALGADWSFVLGADALSATDPNRAQLDQIVRTVAEPLVEHVRSLGGPSILTGAGILARHRCVDLLVPLSDLAARRDHAVWLLAPQSSGSSHDLDGAAVPVGAPTQWLTLPTAWVLEPPVSAIA